MTLRGLPKKSYPPPKKTASFFLGGGKLYFSELSPLCFKQSVKNNQINNFEIFQKFLFFPILTHTKKNERKSRGGKLRGGKLT